MDDARYQVKGSTLLTKFSFVEDRFGGAARTKLEARFADSLPIMPSTWYDYDLYVSILEEIARAHYRGDLSRLVNVGRYSAEKSLGSIYQAFLGRKDFLDFLHGLAQLHHMFYNLGKLKIEMGQDGHRCRICHRDKPRAAEADLYVAAGFYEAAATMHGLRGVGCTFEPSPEGADFELHWSPASG